MQTYGSQSGWTTRRIVPHSLQMHQQAPRSSLTIKWRYHTSSHIKRTEQEMNLHSHRLPTESPHSCCVGMVWRVFPQTGRWAGLNSKLRTEPEENQSSLRIDTHLAGELSGACDRWVLGQN